jgi:predicted NAD/FAD-binding protein
LADFPKSGAKGALESLAIVGSGIAGLTSAYFLHGRFDTTVFEADKHVGGHTNTLHVVEDGKSLPIDSGFMVYNEVTYPGLTRLFKELGVQSKPTDMSFSVQHQPLNLEWSGTGFNRLFGERKNLFSRRFWQMLLSVDRFNKEGYDALTGGVYKEYSVRRYIESRQYGNDILELYLLPLMSALWSAPPEVMMGFPINSLLRFMQTHGLLSIYGKYPWLTVDQGSCQYVEKMIAPFRERILLEKPVKKIERAADKVRIVLADGSESLFDQCILACHADQALNLLGNASQEEKTLLGAFKYQKNLATLHTDKTVMPRSKINWASWNYKIAHSNEKGLEAATHYWMNNLQGVSDKVDYFISVNGEKTIAAEKKLQEVLYDHPIFTVEALKAQEQLPTLNEKTNDKRVFFCGSYFRFGFHEDAFQSALNLVRTITGESIWN